MGEFRMFLQYLRSNYEYSRHIAPMKCEPNEQKIPCHDFGTPYDGKFDEVIVILLLKFRGAKKWCLGENRKQLPIFDDRAGRATMTGLESIEHWRFSIAKWTQTASRRIYVP